MEPFINSEAAVLDPNTMGMQFPSWRNSATPFVRQAPSLPPSSPMVNGESDPQSMYAKMNAVNRPPPPQFDPKPFSVPVMTENGIIMCDEALFRNAPNFRGKFVGAEPAEPINLFLIKLLIQVKFQI